VCSRNICSYVNLPPKEHTWLQTPHVSSGRSAKSTQLIDMAASVIFCKSSSSGVWYGMVLFLNFSKISKESLKNL